MMEKINKSISKIDTTKVILAGDFNFRRINWESCTATNKIEKSFLDTLSDNLLTQIVDKPTRGNNILDLIITGGECGAGGIPFLHRLDVVCHSSYI